MAKTLLEVLSENSISTFEAGERYKAHCPFHEGDREPSFTIYPNETYFCFGCKRWGDAVKFLIEYKGITAAEALQIVGVDYVMPKSEKRAIKITNTLKTTKFLYEVTEKYHKYLMENPGPQKYLADRGLTKETIERFKLGYTDGAVLDFHFAEEYEMANEIGLLNKSGGEALSHRITIPNIIENSFVDFIMGRTVINDRAKYLGLRMPKPICGFYEQRNSPIMFLVEGNFDYLILRQWGYPAIVMSGSHVTKSNYNLLKHKVIVIVPDNDDVGTKSGRELHKNLPASMILDYSSFGVKDVAELATHSNGQEEFMKIVREQVWDTSSSSRGMWENYLPISSDSIFLPLT